MDPEKLIATRWTLLSRLKDWGDHDSWQEFFDVYWRLIYGVAIKSGLRDAEAQDVVQEVLLAVAKKVPEIKPDAARGSFKGWLLNVTRWRIADQFRKRRLRGQAGGHMADETRTATADRIPDPAICNLDALWDEEWQRNLMAAATERVKQKVDPVEYQIFDLCVLRQNPVRHVARKLELKLWKVYFAQRKVAELLKREVRKLEKTMR